MAKTKLRGCRPTIECDKEYYSVSAQLGDCVGGIAALHGQKQKLLKRQVEIRLEREFAEQQETALAAEKAQPLPDACEKPGNAPEAAYVAQ